MEEVFIRVGEIGEKTEDMDAAIQARYLFHIYFFLSFCIH